MTTREEQLAQLIGESIRYTRSLTRLEAIIDGARHLTESLATIHDDDPELAPETVAALTALREVLEVVGRASTFLDERRRALFDQHSLAAPE